MFLKMIKHSFLILKCVAARAIDIVHVEFSKFLYGGALSHNFEFKVYYLIKLAKYTILLVF